MNVYANIYILIFPNVYYHKNYTYLIAYLQYLQDSSRVSNYEYHFEKYGNGKPRRYRIYWVYYYSILYYYAQKIVHHFHIYIVLKGNRGRWVCFLVAILSKPNYFSPHLH